MNIYAKEGTKVKVLFDEKGIMNGTDSDKEHAEQHLKALNRYTIDHTEVSSWHTRVFLKEIPGIPFNSVHFEEMKLKNTVTEEQNIIDDNNVLIAIFMGMRGTDKFLRENYNYHSDFNLLIYAWYKFRDLNMVDIKVMMVLKAEIEHANFKEKIAHCICYRDFQSAFQSIVSAIQWYNSIK
jgi:hypothetical protein